MARKRSEKEKIRQKQTEEKLREYRHQGYSQVDLTIGIVKANVDALLIWLPFGVVLTTVYIWRNPSFSFSGSRFFFWDVVFLIAFLLLIPLHEGIHGVTWGFLSPKGFHSIEFGIMWQYMTPYCTCKEPLSKGKYILGAFMPCLLLGLVPSVVGIVKPSLFLFLLGQTMIMGAGGDLAIILKLLRFREDNREVIYLDHPTECGLIVLVR